MPHQFPNINYLFNNCILLYRFMSVYSTSRKRPGRNIAFKLSSELVDATKGSGDAIHNPCSAATHLTGLTPAHIFSGT